MHGVANINLATPRRSSEGVTERGVAASSWTHEEKRRRLEKTHGTNSQLIFVFAKSKLPSYWRWAFFPLGRTFRELAKCYFYRVNYTKHLEMLVQIFLKPRYEQNLYHFL